VIAVDSSALAAVLLGESDGETFADAFGKHRGAMVVSAASVIETTIVVESRRGERGGQELTEFLERFQIVVAPVTPEVASIAREAWRRYGKGRHPAALNYGDLFSYALARSLDVPLLYKGDDFARTDIRSALDT
jgi:ribonuclease VapC